MAEKTVIEITGAFAPETVENILELLLERMATLRVTDFSVETRATSDEEIQAEIDMESFGDKIYEDLPLPGRNYEQNSH